MVNRENAISACGSRLTLVSALLTILSLSPSAQAGVTVVETRAFPKAQMQEKPTNTHAPVMLEADRVDYDQQGNVAVATGHVAVTQGEVILLADKMVYDQNENLVTAIGNVSMLEPNGNVYFSNHAELQDDMKAGVIEQFRGRLIDSSLFAASRARKIDENKTELFKAVYSPCKIACDQNGQGKAPLWEIDAGRALIDTQAQEIKYYNAFFDVYGLPVIYTPYFSHPTPGADNQSGLLIPALMHSDNLGFVYEQPLYYVIGQDKDVTLTPIYTSLAGPVIEGEYRERFNTGTFSIQGSITSAPNTDAAGNPIAGHQIRGNVATVGNFQIDPGDDWGFDIRRATDATYLRLYGFSSDTLLTSRAYAESFNFGDTDRSYGVVQALAFQDLTGQVPQKTIPYALPLADVSYQTEPGLYNSRFTLTGDAMALYREMGEQSRRVSGSAGWGLPYISDDGQVLQFNAQMRTDLYDVSDVTLPDGRDYNGIAGREVPQLSAMWRYPFMTRLGETSSLTLEPVVQFASVAGTGNPDKIPNEDSQVPEFTDSNLFSVDRYAGYDLVEKGSSMSYGLRGQAQFFTDKYVDFLIGQHYRIDDDTDFPFSNDPDSHFSDYVGRIGLAYDPVTLAYRYRLDKDTLAVNRSEVDGTLNYYPLTVSTTYLSMTNDPILENQKAITLGGTLNLTQTWSLNASGNEDLLLHEISSVGTGLTFKNECLSLTTMVQRDYTHLLDVKPSTNIMFMLSLKNLE